MIAVTYSWQYKCVRMIVAELEAIFSFPLFIVVLHHLLGPSKSETCSGAVEARRKYVRSSCSQWKLNMTMSFCPWAYWNSQRVVSLNHSYSIVHSSWYIQTRVRLSLVKQVIQVCESVKFTHGTTNQLYNKFLLFTLGLTSNFTGWPAIQWAVN